MKDDSVAMDVDQLLAHLSAVRAEGDVPEWARNLIVVIEGDHVPGSIDYLVAQSIAQLQQIVYRIAAHSLYGESASVKNLSEQDLEAFKLTFKVDAGCTHLAAKVLTPFFKLLEEVFKGMSPAQKLLLATILSLAFLGYVVIDRAKAFYTEQEKSNTFVALSQEETKRLDLLLEHTKSGGDEAATNFSKAVRGASGLKFGARSYSREQLIEAQKRTPRTPTNWENVDGAYVVLSIDKQKEDVVWVVIRDVESGESFKASYTIESDDESDDAELQSKLADSLLHGSVVRLKLNIGTKSGGGKVVKASILEFLD